jgi:DNA replication and repair protein RecF
MLQRNTLLRGGIIDPNALDPWDLQVVTTGNQIDAWRREFLQDIEPRFVRLCKELGLEIDLSLSFKSGWGDEDLETVLKKSRFRDIKARTSTYGPQRADFDVLRATHRAVDTLSRGQLKIANFALVLAQLQAAGSRGIEPVLCLDDIGAELDTVFLERVWAQILSANAQVLATGITTERIGLRESAVKKSNVFHVKRGMIELM